MGFWDLLASPEQKQETLQNLYAQGYMGEGDPNKISPGRSGLGALLQQVGILGPAGEGEGTPLQRYEYQRGAAAHQKEDLSMEKERQAMRMQGLTGALGLVEHGATSIPSDFGLTQEDTGVVGDVMKTFGEKQARQERRENLYEEHMRALIDKETKGEGGGGPGQFVSETVNKAMQNPMVTAHAKNYIESIKAATEEKNSSNPNEEKIFALHSNALSSIQNIGRIMQMQAGLYGNPAVGQGPKGEPVTLGDYMTQQAIGGMVPESPYIAAYGAPPDLATLLERDPQMGEEFRQLHRIHKTSGGILDMLQNLNPLSAQPAE